MDDDPQFINEAIEFLRLGKTQQAINKVTSNLEFLEYIGKRSAKSILQLGNEELNLAVKKDR